MIREVYKEICWPLLSQRYNINKCDRIGITRVSKNTPSGKCEQGIKVSRTSRRTEERTTFTSGYQRERRIQSRENPQQKNYSRKREILSMMV